MDFPSTGLIRDADRAAARGDLAGARRLLEEAAKSAAPDIDLLLKLGAICRASGDLDGALAATDKALQVDPLHFVALMLRASLLESLKRKGVAEAYGRALAQRPEGVLPPQLEAMVNVARAHYLAFQAGMDRDLTNLIAGLEEDFPAEEAARIARFRTNALRITRPYHSDPTDYHYPGLIEQEFHDRRDMKWLERLEAATDLIAEDFARVMAAERAELVPYVQYAANQPLRQWKALNHSSDWSAVHLLRNGVPVEANARHCAATMDLLATLPQPVVDGVSPNAMFSLLAPHTHIPPHNGVANTRLVCHLPLIVPADCWFRVGAERREWRRGEAWVFDDTIEHEAANDSDALRVVFICDVWHPGLSDREKRAVAAVVAARDWSGDGLN
jgi:hypothetical protein